MMKMEPDYGSVPRSSTPLMERQDYNMVKGSARDRLKRITPRPLWIIIGSLSVVTFVFIICFVVFYLRYYWLLAKDERAPWLGPGPSPSQLGRYKHLAVASDAASCASVGNYFLYNRGGSTMDAAIATLLCNGIINIHSMGVGGGFFMVYYDRATKTAYTMDARDVAPGAATQTMFVGKPDNASLRGGLSVAVPGEIKGYYQAWEKFGKLPWKDLFEPTIHMLSSGYYIADSLAVRIVKHQSDIEKTPALKEMLLKPNGQPKQAGDKIQNLKLAETLTTIANNPFEMFNGSLTTTMANEIQGAGGIITANDLEEYKPLWRDPIRVPLEGKNLTVHALAPPSSGVLVSLLLNILGGYGFSSKTLDSLQSTTTFYHRAVETLKFVYAKRSYLGDSSFVNMSELVKNFSSAEYARYIRSKINDHRTYPPNYYGPNFDIPEDHGTTHLSLIGPDGDAVSVTSSINGAFGSYVVGSSTGIIYNNGMDDFSTPNMTNDYGFPASPSNFIQPGKRPMSSMSPIVVTDGSGDVRLVLGTSGGSRIISVTAMVAAYNLFLEENIKQAIDHVRFHHQLLPPYIQTEVDFPKVVLDALVNLGHKIGPTMSMTACQGIQGLPNGTVLANADYRKEGRTSGE